jgi:hypothetical protein
LSLTVVALLVTAGLAQTGRPASRSLAYSRLKDKPRELFDRWAADQKQTPPLLPAEMYERLTVSQRTTYEAATHALTRSRLTDESGRRTGTAIDLIDSLESILGEDKGKRGDVQFRLYVRLAPDARQRLAGAREFTRDKDNTVFHKGYPVSFRQGGRYPSIQFSMTPDGARADIDVDYNSSRLPQALFNGHLKASNSDVRAGVNYLRHIFKWTGLLNWWPRLFAAVQETAAAAPVDVVEPDLPDTVKIERIEDAAQEFFNDWLVRRNPRSARRFYSAAGSACVNDDDDSENEVLNTRDARALFVEMLQATNRAVGRQRSLATAVEAVAPWDPEMKTVTHPNEAFFTLVSVGDAEAEEFMCKRPPPADAASAAASPSYGNYYQTIFTIKTKRSEGSMSLLWKNENDGWRIVSFDDLDP